ncbi:MAG: transposase [Patescibacteria group bacterium]
MSTTKNYRISKDVKEQILKRIKEEGVSVSKAAEEHGISTHTIYRWLSGTVENNPSIREFNALKKQNQELLALIGELTIKLSQTQKKI